MGTIFIPWGPKRDPLDGAQNWFDLSQAHNQLIPEILPKSLHNFKLNQIKSNLVLMKQAAYEINNDNIKQQRRVTSLRFRKATKSAYTWPDQNMKQLCNCQYWIKIKIKLNLKINHKTNMKHTLIKARLLFMHKNGQNKQTVDNCTTFFSTVEVSK